MTTPTGVLRFAGVALVAAFAFWAGSRVYSTHVADRAHRTSIRVPAGEASAPTLSDLATDFNTAAPHALSKIPERLPSFSLTDREGKSTPITGWPGKSLIVNFWATWCAPCRREIPLLKALHREWADRDITVVGVAVDSRDKALAYAEELGITYPLLIGEQDALDAAAAFGVTDPAFPFTVFTDRRGEVVALYLGELHQAQADLILKVVQGLNQDRLALPEARQTIAEGLHALATASPG
jgi:thiol-disulfide isomerase/thioredoxin